MARRRKWGRVIVALLLAAVAYLLLWPSKVDPVALEVPPPPPEAEGIWAPNERLRHADRFAEGLGEGPEDVALGPDGLLYTGLRDGRILRMSTDGSGVETFVDTGGRPLGMQFDGNGDLVVADARKGLLRIDAGGDVQLLTDRVEGRPIPFADDLDIAADGKIWFSGASTRFDPDDSTLDALEGRATGQLLSYDPETGETASHLQDLHYANGVTVWEDDRFVLVAETFAYRIRRYWITTDAAGTDDIFAENLPGYPDNINRDRHDTLWVALIKPRDPKVDALHPWPFVRRILGRLPEWALPVPAPFGWVAALDSKGRVRDSLQDPTGNYGDITSATPLGGQLILGSLHEHAIARIPSPQF